MQRERWHARRGFRRPRSLFRPLYLGTFLAMTVPLPCVAQLHPTHIDSTLWGGFSIGLSLGWEQAREDLLVPMRWAGLGAGLRLRWGDRGGARKHAFDLLIPFSLYENRFGHRGYGLGIEVGYGYAIGTVDTALRGALALGGQARWDLHDGFYQSWDEEHAYWLSSLSVGPRLVWTRAGSPTLRFTFEMPVIAAVSRPPKDRLNKMDPLTRPSFHLVDMQRHMRLTGVLELLAFRGGVTLRPLRGPAFLLSYDVEYVRFGDPEKVLTLSHRFTLSRGFGR